MDRFLIKQAAYLPFGTMLAVTLWALFVPRYSSISQHLSELQLLQHPIALVTRIVPIVVGLSVMAFGIGVFVRSRGAMVFTAVTALVFGAANLAGQMGKTQRHRDLPEPYVLLRRLTAFHDDEVRTTSILRQRLHAALVELFPDYDRSAQFTFSKTGRVLLRERLLCPYRLARLGPARLLAMLRRRVPGVKTVTAERLVTVAEASVRSAPPPAVARVLSHRLAILVAELEVHEGHAEALKSQIEALGDQLKADGALPPLDEAVSGLTLFNLARLLGQTGPLDDFASKRQLLRYAGMNLRERASGTYKGQTRLSKKGRPLLRKVLGQTVFPLLRGDRLLGAPYAERCQRMKRTQAMVAAMRKLLVMIWGAHRSGESFDPERVYRCQSQFPLAA